MVSEGEIVVARLPQADGGFKLRPVVVLRKLPGFGDFLVCGVSSQLRQTIQGFDIVLDADSADFAATGLSVSSVVRLAFLAVVSVAEMKRRLGKIAPSVLEALQNNLAQHLTGHQVP
jgi:mRNA interferase MazF